MLITGLHTVADIFCTCCNTNLGWKYVSVPRAGGEGEGARSAGGGAEGVAGGRAADAA